MSYRRISLLLVGLFWLASCGESPVPETTSPSAETATAAASDDGTTLKEVPRNRTLILDCGEFNTCSGQIQDYASFNPYLPGGVSRIGYNFLYEPLYFYNAYKETDNLIPWIAESHHFNDDYTEVTVKIRPGVEWSDGTPWTAHDLVFTINMLRANAPILTFSTDMETWVSSAEAVDDLTARITLTAPNPRFIFSYFTHNFDNGVPIVPKHIWEGKEPADQFANFDPAQNWPVVSGPYKMVLSVPTQRIWDRRDDWWAAKTGFHDLPKVERLIYLTYMEGTKRVQNVIGNVMDSSLDLRPPNIKSAVDGNPNVTTWSGRKPPYGYLDWWPICLGFNDLEEPFSNPQIRWAINHAINRDQLVEVGWQGSGSKTLLPFPEFPSLKGFTGQIQDLLDKYPVEAYDLEASARIMEAEGWSRDDDDFWVKDGQRLKVTIDIAEIFKDLTPVLAAQLKKAGFDAGFRMTSDSYTRQTQGEAMAYLFGNGGSVRDPYFTLRLYHSRFIQPTGTSTPVFWRWKNEEFDRLVDEMGQTAHDDPALVGLFHQAMDIWLAELPSIPLVQWYHRIPHNQTYWKNWPSAENPYINSAYWHRTWLLVLLGLEPAQG